MTTLIIEAKIADKGVNRGEFRIPRSLSDMLKDFLVVNDGKSTKMEIMDNKDNKEYIEEVEIFDNGKGISIKTKAFESLNLNEDDLIRLIKTNETEYKIEIIRSNTDEYTIWERYCINNIKGTKRRYGII